MLIERSRSTRSVPGYRARARLGNVCRLLTAVLGALAAIFASQPAVAAAAVNSEIVTDTWYLPTTDGAARLFVEEIGPPDAPPIVVLHAGWGAEHSYLDPLLRPFADAYHRFVLYDQRGSLLSSVKDYRKVSLRKQIDDLELLRTTLGVEKLTLFAHSMGTFLAMAYTEAHPDHVARLILTGSIPAKSPPGGSDAFWVAGKAYVDELVARPETQREIAMATPASRRLTPRDETHLWRIKLAATNVFHVERWRDVPGGRAFYNQAVADAMEPTVPKNWDYERLLSDPARKVTVIDGDHDFADPGQIYWRAFASAHSSVRLSVLPEAGHDPWIDEPELFARALKAAIAN